ncbi:MAG: DUF2807 domain-containing protein, partial [Pseudomonadota bacterium]|nr:DUF2807 domain-containing protein [Pseudomonadota bacterium]
KVTMLAEGGIMRITLALLFAAALAVPASAADRNYSVTSFDRIRVEGPYAVSVTTSVAPFARAKGALPAIDGVSLRVEGRTLYVRADRSASGGKDHQPAGPVTIAVGTHDLAHVSLSGSGSVAIDRVRGLDFTLLVSGAGSASVAKAELDNLRVSVVGSAQATVAGKAKQFTANIRGAGVLDAAGLATKDAAVSALGPATVRANANNSAKITASGTATVAIAGGGACTLKVSGSATVTGCP